MSPGLVTIGVEAHKTLHVAVALNDAGQPIGEWSGSNTVSTGSVRHRSSPRAPS